MILYSAQRQIELLIRLQQSLMQKKVKLLPVLLQYYINIVYGCDISPLAKIGKSLKIAHVTGIVIGAGSIIGNNVIIFQQVTLGSNGRQNKSYPTIEDDVIIYAGAKIIGGVTIGRGSRIGANSVVTKSIPPFSVAAGNPANVLRTLDSDLKW